MVNLKWTSQTPISQSYNPEPKPTWPNLEKVKSNDLFNLSNTIFIESLFLMLARKKMKMFVSLKLIYL